MLIFGEGNGNPLQYSCLEICMDRGAWWTTVPRGPKELDTTEQLSTENINSYHILFMKLLSEFNKNEASLRVLVKLIECSALT